MCLNEHPQKCDNINSHMQLMDKAILMNRFCIDDNLLMASKCPFQLKLAFHLNGNLHVQYICFFCRITSDAHLSRDNIVNAMIVL